jgi:hypothetical protein
MDVSDSKTGEFFCLFKIIVDWTEYRKAAVKNYKSCVRTSFVLQKLL